jgi:hypothetical protein
MSGMAGKRNQRKKSGRTASRPSRPRPSNPPRTVPPGNRKPSRNLPPAKKKSAQWSIRNARIAVSAAFAALAVLSAIATLLGASGRIQISLGIVLLLIALLVMAMRRHLRGWVAAPMAVSCGLIVISISLGGYGYSTIRGETRKEQRAAIANTCTRAANFRESYTTALDGLVASGWNSQQQDRAIQQFERDLAAVTEAANETHSEDVEALVHQIRSSMLTAFHTNDLAKHSQFMMQGWKSFRDLNDVCQSVGVSLPLESHPSQPEDPSRACEALIKLIKISKSKPSPAHVEAFRLALAEFEYNGVNLKDKRFANDVNNFIYALSGQTNAKEAFESVREDCLRIGIPVPSVAQ